MSNRIFTQASVCAALTLLAAHATCAQTTANITIDGTFVPPSCAVSIAGGGTVDYGTMTRATVLAYGNYASTPAAKALPVKATSLSLSCPSATVIGLSWSDNRAATKSTIDANDVIRFGMTNSNSPGQVLGSFHIVYGTPTSSTGGAINIGFIQPETGGSWTTVPPTPGAPVIQYPYPGYVSSFGRTATSTTTPVAFLDLTVPLSIEAGVNTSIVTSSTSSIKIDGSATVTLKYF